MHVRFIAFLLNIVPKSSVMKRLLLILAFGGFSLAASIAFAQNKSVYVSAPSLGSIGYYDCTNVLETGIPGSEFGFSGSLEVYDSLFNITEYVYLMLTDAQGIPQQLHLFQDTTATIFGPRSHDVCIDGWGGYYHALGTRGKQVVMRTDAAGQVIWAREGDHHEFHAVTTIDTNVYLLGQGESVAGAHDFSLVRTDSAGRGYIGMMLGTTGEDNPEDMIATDHHLVMAGRVYQAPSFQMVVVKADQQLEQVWGHSYQVSGKGLQCKLIEAAPDGSGYVLSGYATGGSDSIFVAKLDTAGNPIWARLYGIQGVATLGATGIAAVDSGFVICGKYRGPVYDLPFVLKIDGDGALIWSKTYAPLTANIQETLEDIVAVDGGASFMAAGNRFIDNNFIYDYSINSIGANATDGDLDCDSYLLVQSVPAALQMTGTTITQPFFSDTSTTFLATVATASLVEQCTLTVANEEPIPSIAGLKFANPVSAQLSIQVMLPGDALDAEISLHTALGQVIERQGVPAGESLVKWNVEDLPAGLYFVVLHGEGHQPVVGRVLVQH